MSSHSEHQIIQQNHIRNLPVNIHVAVNTHVIVKSSQRLQRGRRIMGDVGTPHDHVIGSLSLRKLGGRSLR